MKSIVFIAGITICLSSMSAIAQHSNYISANAGNKEPLSFSFSGGAFKSYGCAPIDPTYWMSGNGHYVTITFTKPESNPSLRVWGMNTDDAAAISVNDVPYPLTSESASYAPKVVCGTSPGPNGVLFSDGNLVGANTPSEANLSYQDVMINAVNITTITITGLKGAGWGFAGVLLNRTQSGVSSDTKPTTLPSTAPLNAPRNSKPQDERDKPRN